MRKIFAVAALAAIPLALAAAPAQASSSNATVYVLHAVPDLPVDVYVNGEVLLPDFQPGTLTDAQSLPAGDYDLAVRPAGADPASPPAIEANAVAVPAGANITVVAHLTESGDPTLTPFVNDTASLPAGEAGLTVRHTAAAPAVDVRANGAVALAGLTNPNEASATVPAGTISADVTLAGTDTVAIGPADLDLAEGTRTIVYAWGSAEAGNLALAVQTLTGLHSSPSGVPSGQAGLADTGSQTWMIALGLVAVAGAGVAGRKLAVARSRG